FRLLSSFPPQMLRYPRSIHEPLFQKSRMLNLERRTKILELLDKHGQVAVVELSKRFKTSEVTIRNDLKDLHARGLVRRAHGGAVKVTTVSMDPSLNIKAELHADEKRRI